MKIFMVDDDIEMLNGLEAFVPWAEYGFQLVGKSNNAYDSLDEIKATKPDILVTDITMPGINGFELARECKAVLPDLKVVFLTCHEDFEYAREAFKLQAEDYLVKHTLTEEELLEKMLSLKTAIEEQKRNRQYLAGVHANKDIIAETYFK
ncbi:MAG: response regulator, partial [Gorillibacterium sp.]|nr:response regulator [Gorillibacterium sp.]